MPQAVPYLIAGGTGISVAGTLQAGKEAEKQGKSEAAWHEYNAQLAEREGEERQAAAAEEERRLRKRGVRGKATARTQYAQAGVTLEGSPMDFLESYASEIELGALEIRRTGQVGAQEMRTSAALSRYAGKSAILRGRSAKRASRWKALGTGLMGAASLATPTAAQKDIFLAKKHGIY